AENLGPQACPYGVGFHPYLTLGGPIEAARLRLSAARVSHAVRPGAPRRLGPLGLATCFCELRRHADGRARVTLADDAAAVTLWLGEAFSHLMVYTGDPLAAERRRRGLAVEPMSCAPNVFAGGEGLVLLQPR